MAAPNQNLSSSPHPQVVIDDDEDYPSAADIPPRSCPEHSMATSFRRPSFVQPGTRPAIVQGLLVPENAVGGQYLSPEERHQITRDERSLLRDNNIIPPRNLRTGSEDGIGSKLTQKLSFSRLRKTKSSPDEEANDSSNGPTETTSLLGARPAGASSNGGDATPVIDQKWEEAVLAGLIKTTWRREAKVLGRYSAPLILTFLLQYSLTVASVFTVGHIGKTELGAVSLASSEYKNVPGATHKLMLCSDGEHHRLCSVSWPCNQSRHLVCPGIWLWSQNPSWIATAENGLLLVGCNHSNCNRLAQRHLDSQSNRPGKGDGRACRFISQGHSPWCSWICCL